MDRWERWKQYAFVVEQLTGRGAEAQVRQVSAGGGVEPAPPPALHGAVVPDLLPHVPAEHRELPHLLPHRLPGVADLHPGDFFLGDGLGGQPLPAFEGPVPPGAVPAGKERRRLCEPGLVLPGLPGDAPGLSGAGGAAYSAVAPGGGVPVFLFPGALPAAGGGLFVLWGHQAPVRGDPHPVDVLLRPVLPGGAAAPGDGPGGGGKPSVPDDCLPAGRGAGGPVARALGSCWPRRCGRRLCLGRGCLPFADCGRGFSGGCEEG